LVFIANIHGLKKPEKIWGGWQTVGTAKEGVVIQATRRMSTYQQCAKSIRVFDETHPDIHPRRLPYRAPHERNSQQLSVMSTNKLLARSIQNLHGLYGKLPGFLTSASFTFLGGCYWLENRSPARYFNPVSHATVATT
jgi:hypothetical protein